MSNELPPDNNNTPDGQTPANADMYVPGPNALANFKDGTTLIRQSITDELKQSYLTYSMSVIVSRALQTSATG